MNVRLSGSKTIVSLRYLLALLLMASCIPDVMARTPEFSDREPASAPYVQFSMRFPRVTEEMLEPAFWVKKLSDPDRLIMTPEEIRRFNQRNLRECSTMRDIQKFPGLLSRRAVIEMVEKVSARPKRTLYLNNQEIGDHYYESLRRNLNLDDATANPPIRSVKFGITVKRTEMRSFPTFDRVFSELDDYEFDRFIETALYPLEPLAIVHQSADGKWYLAQAYNYLAWVPVENVALIDRVSLFSYLGRRDFLVVTGKRVFTGYNPKHPEISELLLDMGVRVPLAKTEEISLDIAGQHPAGNFVVKLPARGHDGGVEWRLGLISRTDEVRVGYLPYTRRNIIRQAFKFLGQRYGWGGMFNTRDCSAFVLDNLRTMGVLIPRNAGEQGKLSLAVRHRFDENMTLEERRAIMRNVPPVTPIYMDGHAMLYLCAHDDDYYIIHDFAGFSAPDEAGKMQRSRTRGVMVTPLLATYLGKEKTYLEGMYAACEFRLP
ncbi:MAG: SH3 domain-containing protein [Candidatus Zixiibacteriota bacterium]